MEHDQMDKRVARQSALIYLPISLAMVVLFLLAARLLGSYPLVAQLGGAVWVGLLSLIVAMPVITARVKKATRP